MARPKPPPYPKPPRPPAEPPRPQPGRGGPITATTIRQIELQLYKAEHGLGMPYDAERVAQLRSMLREARKRKLSGRLAAKRGHPPSDER